MKKLALFFVLIMAGCVAEEDVYVEEDTTDEDTTEDSLNEDYWNGGECGGPDLSVSFDCQDVTFEGMCDDEGRVVWCEDEALYCIDCPSNDMVCSFVQSVGWYNCVESSQP